MRHLRLLVIIVLFILFTGSARAAEPTLVDVVPSDGAGALLVRNLDEFRARGDEFLKQADYKPRYFRPSQVISLVMGSLGVSGIVDEKKPLGIVVAKPLKEGKSDYLWQGRVVAVMPLQEREKVANRFGIDKKKFKEGTFHPLPARTFGKLLYLRGNYFYLGDNRESILSVARGKSLGSELKAERRKQLNDADLLLYLGPRAWGSVWTDFLKELETALAPRAQEKEATRQILTSLKNVRYGAVTLRVDRGLRFRFLSAFGDDDRKTVSTFLSSIRGGPGHSDLKGLPLGKVLLAESARGKGSRTTALARVMLDSFLNDVPLVREVVASSDRHNVVSVFASIWKRLEGNRLAVYLTGDARKQGLVSLVAILDARDPDGFLRELKELARLGNPATLNLDLDKGKKEDIELIEKLIADLGSDSFQTREAASTRLGLVGEPALPYLKKALKSRDFEVVRRARILITTIEGAGAQRRKDLLSDRFKYRLRPTFTYYPQAESRLGHAIDVIEVEVDRQDPAVLRQMQGLFGPHWDKIRLAKHDKQVIVLIGSDLALL
jgi:hypothetical protein